MEAYKIQQAVGEKPLLSNLWLSELVFIMSIQENAGILNGNAGNILN